MPRMACGDLGSNDFSHWKRKYDLAGYATLHHTEESLPQYPTFREQRYMNACVFELPVVLLHMYYWVFAKVADDHSRCRRCEVESLVIEFRPTDIALARASGVC